MEQAHKVQSLFLLVHGIKAGLCQHHELEGISLPANHSCGMLELGIYQKQLSSTTSGSKEQTVQPCGPSESYCLPLIKAHPEGER